MAEDWKKLFTEKQTNLTPPDSTKPRSWKDLFGAAGVDTAAKQMPAAPKWSDVIEPAQKRTETADNFGEFVVGGVAKFDQALAGMFNQLDYIQTAFGDALNTILVGKETANGIKDIRNKYGVDVNEVAGKSSINAIRPFKAVSNAIDFCYKDAKELPNTMMGDIVGGIGAIGPEILAAAVTPEIATGKLLTKLGLPIFSKFGTVMAAEGMVTGMENAEQGTTIQKLTTPVVSAFEQYLTGQMYDFMGAMSSKLGGKLANRFVPEIKTAAQAHSNRLIHSTGTTTFNALLFGGYGTANEFLETGKTSWKTFGTGVGMGIGMGGREIAKGLWAKGMNSFMAADMETIKRAAASELNSDELISNAQNKTNAVENKTSKNPEGDITSALLSTNTGLLKSVLEEIKENPQDVIKSVEESTLPTEVKKHLTDKINQVSAETDPMVSATKSLTDKISDIDAQIDMVKKNTNLAPVLQDIKIKSMAAKRDALVSKVIKLTEEPAPVSDEKKAEDTRQARIIEAKAAQKFPQFQEQGKAIAEEFGGRFESRLKSVESTTGKTARENIEVTDVKDIMGGAIIVGDMKDFKSLSKRLKKEGYAISNKRTPNKDTGRRGVYATKVEDGISSEIQLHTEKTWEAQKKAEAIRDKYRKEGIPPIDQLDVEINPAKYKPEEQVKATEEFGGSTFSVGGESLAGKKGKAAVGIFPERGVTIVPEAGKPEEMEPKFPEGLTPDVQKRKSGKDKVYIEDAEGNEVSSITFKTVNVNGEKYWSIQQAATATGHENKGYATNLYKYAMQNLPEGYKGIISPASSRQNTTQVPKIHEKLSKIYKVEKNEAGDLIFRVKKAGVSSEDLRNFIEKNKDILEENGDVLSIGTWKDDKGNIILDITATPSREKAMEMGKKYNQISIFDLEKMEEVPVGGTGENINPTTGKPYTLADIPIEERIKELRITPRTLYEEAMEESRKTYEEGYEGLENIDLEGSPAKTPLERKMRALEIPVSTQKELKKAWTETKQKMLGELKGKNADIKQAFNDFIKDLPRLTDLNIKLRPAMLRKVNAIDFTKPKSLDRAIEYFDKIVNDATFRLNVIEYERSISKLEHYTSPEYLLKKENSILKNKIGPTGLPLADELKAIREDMVNGDWGRAQDAIYSMLDIYAKENRPLTDKELDHITRLNFTGLLNPNNRADLRQMQGAVKSLQEIIKFGKTKAAAKRMMEREAQDALAKEIFNVIDGKPGKPVQLDQQIATNQRVGMATQLARYLNWMQTDSWFSLLDKFSKYDKESDPYKSVLNKVLGGTVVEADINEVRGKMAKFTEVEDKFKEIFGVNKKSAVAKISRDNTTTLHDLKYKNIIGTEETLPITMNQAYKVYMELQDPTLIRANEAGGWMRDGELTDKGESLIKLLTPEVKAWADWQLNEFYPKYYNSINEVYRRIYGTDMPMGEKYSPIFVAKKVGVKEGGDVDDMLAQQNITTTASNGSLKVRVNHNEPLALIDGDKVLTNYIEKMEYFINWSDALRLLNDTFVRNKDIRAALRQNFGPTSLQVVDNFINDFSRAPKDLNRLNKAIDNFRKNFTVASLAIKPTVFFAQLTSLPAYMEQVPVADYAKQFAITATHWTGPDSNKKIFDLIKEDPFWKERYQQGWDRDVIDAMQKDLQTIQGRNGINKFKDISMFLTKYGDMGSILVGGLPLYRYEYQKALKEGSSEREARARAMASFTDATRNSQQAGQTYDLSVIQRANSFTKLLTMYKTSPFQYHRKVMGAMRNLVHGRGTVSSNMKTIFIYHVLLPQLFQMIGNGFKWDKKDQMQALALGNFNEVFIAGDILKGLMNTVRGLPFPYQASPIESTGRTAQQAIQHLDQSNVIKAVMNAGEDVSMPDVLKAIEDLSKVTGDVTGMPVRGTYAIAKGIYDVSTGQTEQKDILHKAARILGWSESALRENSKNIFDDDLTSREVKGLIEDTKNPTLEKIYEKEDNRVKSVKKPLPGKSVKAVSLPKKKPLPHK
jgi:hypothetical protein